MNQSFLCSALILLSSALSATSGPLATENLEINARCGFHKSSSSSSSSIEQGPRGPRGPRGGRGATGPTGPVGATGAPGTALQTLFSARTQSAIEIPPGGAFRFSNTGVEQSISNLNGDISFDGISTVTIESTGYYAINFGFSIEAGLTVPTVARAVPMAGGQPLYSTLVNNGGTATASYILFLSAGEELSFINPDQVPITLVSPQPGDMSAFITITQLVSFVF